MADVAGARTFAAGADAYARFMGRYSSRLADAFADFAEIPPRASALRVLDVGCGPGAFTTVAVARGDAELVSAVDPSPGFVESCRRGLPGVTVARASAEQLPFDDGGFDRVVAQLVLHFVSDPVAAVAEMRRVARPGGLIAACVWDFEGGMEMLRAFWDAALSVDPDAPDEARTLAFGRPGEIAAVFAGGGLTDIVETTLQVESTYADVDELWQSLLGGIGPAGGYLVAQPAERQHAIRDALTDRLGRPDGSFTLSAVARACRATVPAPVGP